MSKNEARPVTRTKDIVIQELGDEILIYDLNSNKAFSLNETSALVWQAADGNKTVSEISEQISRHLNTPVNEDFVWLALDQLKKGNLIENKSEISTPFEGLSRREVIRRVGLASIVALPIISSLVAPPAISAQSACAGTMRPVGCVCDANNQCANNCCGTTQTGDRCVTPLLKPIGAACRSSCECVSNSCPFAPAGAPRVCARTPA